MQGPAQVQKCWVLSETKRGRGNEAQGESNDEGLVHGEGPTGAGASWNFKHDIGDFE